MSSSTKDGANCFYSSKSGLTEFRTTLENEVSSSLDALNDHLMELVLLEGRNLCILAGKMHFFSFSCQEMFQHQNIFNSLRNIASISLYSYLFIVTVNFYWSKLVQVVLCKCTTREKTPEVCIKHSLFP